MDGHLFDVAGLALARNDCEHLSLGVAPDPAMSRRKVIIGSRDSELAMKQSRLVQAILQAHHADVDFEIVSASSLGDKDLSKPLAQLASANPGLFTKELEVGEAHCCVVAHRQSWFVTPTSADPRDFSPRGIFVSCRWACWQASLTSQCTP